MRPASAVPCPKVRIRARTVPSDSLATLGLLTSGGTARGASPIVVRGAERLGPPLPAARHRRAPAQGGEAPGPYPL